MFEPDQHADAFDQNSAFDLLSELERNTPDEIRRQRAHTRLALKAQVIIRPGNASDLLKLKVRGVTGDVSEGGCRILSPVPLRVGDIYRLDFDRRMLDVPLAFARCLRCQLVREDAFEVGFAFFRPLPLGQRHAARTSQSLL